MGIQRGIKKNTIKELLEKYKPTEDVTKAYMLDYDDFDFTKEQIKKFERERIKDETEDKKWVEDMLKKFTKEDFDIYDSISDIDRAKEYFFKRYLVLQESRTPKKLKIGVKRINETEAAIKNQEKTIKSKKKQILNEQEYLNTMGKIMTGESNFIDNKGKWAVATELDVKEGLNPKIRRALKKSIIEQANKIKGTNIIMDI